MSSTVSRVCACGFRRQVCGNHRHARLRKTAERLVSADCGKTGFRRLVSAVSGNHRLRVFQKPPRFLCLLGRRLPCPCTTKVYLKDILCACNIFSILHTRTSTRTHARTHARTHERFHTRARARIHTRARARARAHTHTPPARGRRAGR